MQRFIAVLLLLLACLACSAQPAGGNNDGDDDNDNGAPDRQVSQPLHDAIAYARGDGDEIRLIDPDGGNDRPLWAHGHDDPEGVYDVWSMTWNPAATELAFASTHENWCSFNHADIFSVGADGTGYRRITQAPACPDLAAYPKGTVRVPVANSIYNDSFVGFMYFQGAPGIQQVSLPPGGSGTVTFENVADFGDDFLQVATIIVGGNRDLVASSAADVLAGGAVTSATVDVYSPSNLGWEARAPTWRADGSMLGYAYGFASLYQIPAEPAPLDFGEPLLTEDTEMPDFVFHLAWGPTAETADQVLFQGNVTYTSEGVYLTTEGSVSVGEPVLAFDAFESILGLAWLPDGSGFVFSVTEGDFFGEDRSANLFVYDFTTDQLSRVTTLSGEFAGQVSVSGDGQRFVFERAAELDPLTTSPLEPDLWVVNRDGSGLRLLVEDAHAPAWSW